MANDSTARTSGRATITEIARATGVTHAAVSFALNNKPGVSAATRERILGVAQELGWRPSVAARALSGAGSGSIGLVLARSAANLSEESFFLQLIAGIQSKISPLGFTLVFHLAPDVQAEAQSYREWRAEGRVDGVIVVDVREDDPRLGVLEALNLPAVVIGAPSRGGLTLPTLSADDTAPMTALVEELHSLGHRNISLVSGLQELTHTRRRVQAFVAAMQRLALPVPEPIYTDFTEEAGELWTAKLLGSSAPSAIIYDNDVLAMAGLRTALARKIEVPGQLSIVSWEDSLLCRATYPQLTALSRDAYRIGAQSAHMLLGVLRGEATPNALHESPHLERRGSMAAAPTQPSHRGT